MMLLARHEDNAQASRCANNIGDSGQIVGWSNPASSDDFCFLEAPFRSVHGFLWNPSTGMRDLGTLPGDTSSVALKINSMGQVIGSSGNTIVQQSGTGDVDAIQVVGRPFIWSERKGMQDLNTLIFPRSGWVLKSVSGINIFGQIVGSGTLNGQRHGFLLTPGCL